MIQAQKLNRGYPPIQGGLHLPGKRHADWPVSRKPFPYVAVVPVSHAPREFCAGDPEGFESRDKILHTPIITHRRVGATQKCQNGEIFLTRHTLGMEWPLKPFRRRKGARSFLLAMIETGAKYVSAVLLVALSLWGAEAIAPSSLLIRSAVFVLLAFVAVSILGPVSYLATLILSFCVVIVWKE